jgi:DHA1 family multidrug resistance protein-like MFS transporter
MEIPKAGVSHGSSPGTEAARNATLSYALSFFFSVFAALLVPVVPLLAFKMGASQFELGLIGAAVPLTYVPLALLSGSFSDRISRKSLIVLSCFVYSLACVAYALSSTPLHLMVGRLLEGVSTAMLWPAVEALLADSTDVGGSKLVSNFGVLWSSGSLLGGVLSSLVLGAGQYGVVFIPCAGFSLLTGVMLILGLSEKRRSNDVVVGVENGPPVPQRRMLTTWAVAMLYAVCQGTIFSLYPPYAEIMGIPGALIGLAIAFGLAGRTIMFYLYRFLKVGFKTLALAGSILASVFTLQLVLSTEPFIVLSAGFLFGVGMGLCYSAAIRSALDVDSSSRGKYAGLFEGSIGLGYFLGPAIGGAAAELVLQAPYVISSAAALCFAIVIVMERGK